MTTLRNFGRRSIGVAAVLCAACSLQVTNPGPIQDSQLTAVSAVPALVNGMSGDLSYALGNYVDRGGLASGEMTEAGNYSAEQQYWFGIIRPDDVNPDWAAMQQARWSAEKL